MCIPTAGSLGRWVAAAVVFALIGTSSVSASPTELAQTEVAMGNWSFRALLDSDNNGTTTSSNRVLAIAAPATTIGNNIRVILYTRRGGVGTEWDAKAWPATDRYELVKQVADALEIGNIQELAYAFGITGGVSSGPPDVPSEPQDFWKGLFTSDSLNLVITDGPDRDLVIDTLTNAGYPSAKLPIEKMTTHRGDGKLFDWLVAVSPVMHDKKFAQVPVPGAASEPAPNNEFPDLLPPLPETPPFDAGDGWNFTITYMTYPAQVYCGPFNPVDPRLTRVDDYAFGASIGILGGSITTAIAAPTCCQRDCKTQVRREVWHVSLMENPAGSGHWEYFRTPQFNYHVTRWTEMCCPRWHYSGDCKPLPAGCVVSIRSRPIPDGDPTDPKYPWYPDPDTRDPQIPIIVPEPEPEGVPVPLFDPQRPAGTR
jgi:hypothetical protein